MAWVEVVGGVREAARMVGCSEIAVYKWLSGERRPQPAWAAKIEEVSSGLVSKREWYW